MGRLYHLGGEGLYQVVWEIFPLPRGAELMSGIFVTFRS